MRNVLIAAYHFPPMGGSGVQRVVKWSRYLPRAGWRPHVVCAGHGQYPLMDDTLLREVHPSARVHRVVGWEPAGVAQRVKRIVGADRLEAVLAWRLNRLIDATPLPERELLWVPSAITSARRIVDDNSVEAVITSGPPHSTHLVGLHLKRRMQVPWIADLRDAMTDNWAADHDSWTSAVFARFVERQVVRHADHIIVTCPEVSQSLAARHALAPERVSFIPNGYDPTDAPIGIPSRRNERLVIAHVGALYRDQGLAPVLDAITRLIGADSTLRDKIELRIVGSISNTQRASLTVAQRALVTETGYVSHGAAIREMREADVLLLMTPGNPRGRYCIPAKTFEYLAFGGHIFAVVHPGTELERLLRRCGNATVVPSHSSDSIATALRGCLETCCDGHDERRDRSLLAEYRRDHQASRLATLIESVVDGTAPSLRIAPVGSEAAA